MKTSELIEKLKQFGEVSQDTEHVIVRGTDNYRIAVVSRTKMFSLVTDWASFLDLNSIDQSVLFDILCDYAMTPLDERKDEPRFIVRLYPGVEGFMRNPFIERGPYSDRKTRFEGDGMGRVVTYFTLSEYEQLQHEAKRSGFKLPDYDAENTTMFVPVKDGDEE